MLMRDLLSWYPAQIGFAGSQCLVEPAHGRVVRRGLDDFRVGTGFLGNLAHDADEVVESFAGLGFGWLDHHGFVYDEGEVDGRGVHAKIEDTLGDVERGHTPLFLLAFGCCHKLVLAYLRKGYVIVRCQLVFEVVSVEDGALRDVQQAIGAVGANVGVGSHEYAKVALVSAHLANGEWARVFPGVALLALRRKWAGQERYQVFFDADGACTGAAAAMRSAACFMQVEMHYVEAHIARAGDAKYGIGIRAVVVELAASLVYHRSDLKDIAIEESQRVGVGHHDGGDIRGIGVEQCFEVFYQNATRPGVCFDLDRTIIGERGAGRVGAVRVVGDEDDVAMPLAIMFVVGFDEHEARQFAVRACGGLQGDARHTRDFGQVALDFVDQLDGALHGAIRLQWVNACETWKRGHVLVDVGVVFHG